MDGKPSKFFFVFFRSLLLRRTEYAAKVLQTLEDWIESKDMGTTVDQRARLVHGIAYAAFTATASMFGSHTASELAPFRAFMIRAMRSAVRELAEILDVDAWMQDLMSAFTLNLFGYTAAEWGAFFKVRTRERQHPPHAPGQGRWISYDLFIQPRPVYDIILSHKARQGKADMLDQNDLCAQMSRRPYWLGGDLRQRFGQAVQPKYCWGISLDNYPELGYQKAATEQMGELMDEIIAEKRAHGFTGTYDSMAEFYTELSRYPDQWGERADPRKGELYSMVELIHSKTGDTSKKLV